MHTHTNVHEHTCTCVHTRAHTHTHRHRTNIFDNWTVKISTWWCTPEPALGKLRQENCCTFESITGYTVTPALKHQLQDDGVKQTVKRLINAMLIKEKKAFTMKRLN